MTIFVDPVNVKTPEELAAELAAKLLGHVHQRYVKPEEGELVDCSAMTPAEVYEMANPGVELSQEQAVAYNALVEMLNWAYCQGVATGRKGLVNNAERSGCGARASCAMNMVRDFIVGKK